MQRVRIGSKSTQIRPKLDPNSTRIRPEPDPNSTQTRPNFDPTRTIFEPISSRFRAGKFPVSSRKTCELFENSHAAPPNSLTPRPRPKCGTTTGRFRFWQILDLGGGCGALFSEMPEQGALLIVGSSPNSATPPPHSTLLGRTNQTVVRPPLSWGHNTRPHKQTDKKIDSDLQFLQISGRFSKVLLKFWSVALEVQKLKVFFGRTFRLMPDHLVCENTSFTSTFCFWFGFDLACFSSALWLKSKSRIY